MNVPHLAATLVATLTWGGFFVAGNTCFRCARRKNALKTLLIWSGALCTAVELAGMALVQPRAGFWGWTGVSLYLLANVMLWWSLYVHGRERPAFVFTDANPVSLAHSGPYRVLRHPIYSAYLVAWLAAPLTTGQWWMLAMVAWMWLFYYRAARQEEKSFLASPFAPQYKIYQMRTGMFLPRVLPSRSQETSRNSEIRHPQAVN